MISIQTFTFNPFQENTYLLFDETGECVIVDPGCYEPREEEELSSFIDKHGLKPVRLLNTHCHIDHVFGNHFIAEKYKLGLEMHEKDLPILNGTEQYGKLFGLNVMPSPQPSSFLEEGDQITFGNSSLDVLFVPGHAPGHLAFVSREQQFVIAGDVLFYNSIGRTDLPGGDFATLIESIKSKLFVLGNEYLVYPGHGPATKIGFEKEHNPFLN